MIKVDLITGFLGAGKTTFLLRYAKYLMAQGMKIGILVYDHGAVNVDLPLLKELRGEQCELEMLAGLLSGLSNRVYNVLRQSFLNAGPGAPECFIVQKL